MFWGVRPIQRRGHHKNEEEKEGFGISDNNILPKIRFERSPLFLKCFDESIQLYLFIQGKSLKRIRKFQCISLPTKSYIQQKLPFVKFSDFVINTCQGQIFLDSSWSVSCFWYCWSWEFSWGIISVWYSRFSIGSSQVLFRESITASCYWQYCFWILVTVWSA